MHAANTAQTTIDKPRPRRSRKTPLTLLHEFPQSMAKRLVEDYEIKVIPVPAKSKKAVIDDWPDKGISDPAEVEEMVSNDQNYGILTGAGSGPEGGLLIIDVDTKNGKDGSVDLKRLEEKYGTLPETWENASGSGNGARHLLFYLENPEDFEKIAYVLRDAPGLEFRGKRKQTIGPGSIHPDTGERYTFRHLRPIAKLPDKWLQMLLEHGKKDEDGPEPRGEQDGFAGDKELLLEGFRLQIYKSQSGNRSNTLNKVAYALGKNAAAFSVSQEEAKTVLSNAALEIGLEPSEVESTFYSGWSSGRLESNGLPTLEGKALSRGLCFFYKNGSYLVREGNEWVNVSHKGVAAMLGMKTEQLITHATKVFTDVWEPGKPTFLLPEGRNYEPQLNVFVKSDVLPKEGSDEDRLLLEEYLLDLVGGIEADLEYLLQWLARPYQNYLMGEDDYMNRTAVIMVGPQGSGKTTLFSLVSLLYGTQNTKLMECRGELKSDFTSKLDRTLLSMVVEFSTDGKDSSKIVEKLKPMITDSIIPIHEKNKPAREGVNHQNIILNTNHDVPMKLEDDTDRRYSVVKGCKSSKNSPKAKKIAGNGAKYAPILGHILANKEITIPLDEPWDNAARRNLMEESRPPLAVFMDELASIGPQGVYDEYASGVGYNFLKAERMHDLEHASSLSVDGLINIKLTKKDGYTYITVKLMKYLYQAFAESRGYDKAFRPSEFQRAIGEQFDGKVFKNQKTLIGNKDAWHFPLEVLPEEEKSEVKVVELDIDEEEIVVED